MIERSLGAVRNALLKPILEGIRAWLKRELEHLLDGDDVLRRIYTCIDLGVAVLLGMSAHPTITVESAPVRGFYDLAFAFENGDFSKPNCEAGTLLRAMLRVGFAYRGSVMCEDAGRDG